MSAAISPSKVFSTAPLPPDCVSGNPESFGTLRASTQVAKTTAALIALYQYLYHYLLARITSVCEYSWDNVIFLFEID